MLGKRFAVSALVAVSVVSALFMAPAQASPPKPTAPHSGIGTARATQPSPEVTAEYKTADGITHATVYLAAPGVSAAQLYQKLAARHVRGLVNPQSRVTPMDLYCYYNTANELDGCPPLVWARNGYTNPQIYYHDMSSSSWPEGTVISEWNQSPYIHVAWAPSGCPGTSGTHCIPVTDGYFGSTGWQGLTSYSWDVYRHFVDGGVSIQYNDSYSSNHKAVACQETGHAFGMGHNTSTDSCMYYMNPSAGAPDSNDFGEIQYELY